MYLPIMTNQYTDEVFVRRSDIEIMLPLYKFHASCLLLFAAISLILSGTLSLVAALLFWLGLVLIFVLIIAIPRYLMYRQVAKKLVGYTISLQKNHYCTLIRDSVIETTVKLAFGDDDDLEGPFKPVLGEYAKKMTFFMNPRGGQVVITDYGLKLKIISVSDLDISFKIISLRKMGITFS